MVLMMILRFNPTMVRLLLGKALYFDGVDD